MRDEHILRIFHVYLIAAKHDAFPRGAPFELEKIGHSFQNLYYYLRFLGFLSNLNLTHNFWPFIFQS